MPGHKAREKKQKSIPHPRKLFSVENLKYIWKNSNESDEKASGIDGVDVKKFKDNLDTQLTEISRLLFEGKYYFKKLRFNSIPKDNGKHRIICVPAVRDRLVQRLILHLLTNPKDRLRVTNEISYGARKGSGTGTEAAINKAIKLREKDNWVLKTDITAFFNQIDRPDLISLLKKRLKKSPLKALIPLLEQVVLCDILIKNNEEKEILAKNNLEIGKGLRQGMPLSPLLSNVFLNRLDRLTKKKSFKIVRYVDDIIVLCSSEDECQIQKKIIKQALDAIGLSIPSLKSANSKTQIIKPDDSVEFLGMEIFKCKNGKYRKRIPQKKINKILSEIEQYSDYQYISKEQLNYSTLLSRLANKSSGYKAAYKDTTNLNDFLTKLHCKSQAVVNRLLEKIFGADFLKSLSDDKKKFLGID